MSHGADRRTVAQNVVHQHVNRRRGKGSEIAWEFIQVIYHKGLGKGAWLAIVRVEPMNQMLFQVEFTPKGNGKDELKVDTFTRNLVSRFY